MLNYMQFPEPYIFVFFLVCVIFAYAGDILSIPKYLLSAYYGPGKVLGNAENVISVFKELIPWFCVCVCLCVCEGVTNSK